MAKNLTFFPPLTSCLTSPPLLTSHHLSSVTLTLFLHLSPQPHLMPHFSTSSLFTSPHLSSLLSPHFSLLTSLHLFSPLLTSPHLSSPLLTSLHLSSSHLSSPLLCNSHHVSPPHLTSIECLTSPPLLFSPLLTSHYFTSHQKII